DRLFDMEGANFSQKGKELYQKVADSTGRMRNLIQDLLAYAQSNDYEGKLEEVDMNLILNDSINALEEKVAEKKADIRVGNLPALNVVRFQFYQLFLNLLNNALKFSRSDIVPCIVVQSELV